MSSSRADAIFSEAYPRLWQRAYRVAFTLVGSAAVSEDVAQESTVRACQRWASVADHAEPWVARVAYNLAIDEVRRTKRAHPTADPAIQTPPLTEDRLDLVAALRKLPRRQRDVLALRYLGDQSQTATAAELGINESTVARAAVAGLAALRAQLALSEERRA